MTSKLLTLIGVLVLLGWGCTKPVLPESVDVEVEVPVTTPTTNQDLDSATTTVTDSEPAKQVVSRSFTLDEIETEGGGLKNWFRDLARANAAGTKTLVRVPVNRVHGFGCLTPTPFCVSDVEGACFGPFIDLKGKNSEILKTHQACLNTCSDNKATCTAEFMDTQCSVLWEVEGYVVAASKVPTSSGEEGGTCSQGELMYDFEVARVIQKIASAYVGEFKFTEYSLK